MSDQLNVEAREQLGTRATNRLRQDGKVPAVLYGHGADNVHLSIPHREVELMLRHHSKHVKLNGASDDHALVKDLQWDPLGIDVLHVDLLRISLDERVTLTVPVKLHGSPIGLNHHGSTNELLHEVEISVPAVSIPDEVQLNVNDLDVGQSKTAADISLPEGAQLVTPPETVIVLMSEGKSSSDDSDEEGGDE